MIYFIDDLNMPGSCQELAVLAHERLKWVDQRVPRPALDKYNTQSAIELIKQKQERKRCLAKVNCKKASVSTFVSDVSAVARWNSEQPTSRSTSKA